MLLHAGVALADPDYGAAFSALLQEEDGAALDARSLLVLQLVVERCRGAGSRWAPYVSFLPAAYGEGSRLPGGRRSWMLVCENSFSGVVFERAVCGLASATTCDQNNMCSPVLYPLPTHTHPSSFHHPNLINIQTPTTEHTDRRPLLVERPRAQPAEGHAAAAGGGALPVRPRHADGLAAAAGGAEDAAAGGAASGGWGCSGGRRSGGRCGG